MNFRSLSSLRQSLRCARPLPSSVHRAYSVGRPFVPPAQLNDVDDALNSSDTDGRRGQRRPPKSLAFPESPSFFTTRPMYYDQVLMLEKAIGQVQGTLKALHLLPLPEFVRAGMTPSLAIWKNQEEMTADFQTKMTTTRFRNVIKLLNKLNHYYQIAETAGAETLAQGIHDITSMFESGKKDAFLARGKRKIVELDEFGRSYTVGKRKTSAARVWVIPVKTPPQPEAPEVLFDIPMSSPVTSVTTTTILVNNLPINEYFPLPADRERITRPLKVAGVLGAYNIFALVRGGGTTGQSGALAHGISKGVIAHEPVLTDMFKKAKLTRRDPRMVERKKTGLAKARKAYTWVKR